MGGDNSTLQCCMGMDDPNQDASLEEALLDENKTKEPKTNSHFIALSETILDTSDYHYTLISTKIDKKNEESNILSAINCKDKELINCGDRVTDSSMITKNGDLYVVIRRKIDDNDFNELQKYKVKNYKNIDPNDNSIQFEYIKTVEKIFEGTRTNIEGLELIYDSKNEKELGFLLVNDLFGKEEHTQLYFMNIDDHTKLGSVYDFKDYGENQLSCINYFTGLDLDCYIFLPQTLGLSDQDFAHWTATLDEDVFLYSLSKETILKNIEKLNTENDDDNKKDDSNEEELEKPKGLNKVKVMVNGFDNDNCLFKKYSKKNGYKLKGFEALAIDKNNNGVLTFEANENDKTFNFIISCKLELNNKNKLRLIININDYKVIPNNGTDIGNRGQEALFYVSAN